MPLSMTRVPSTSVLMVVVEEGMADESPFMSAEEVANFTGLPLRWIRREGWKAGIRPHRYPGFRKSVYIRSEVISAIESWPLADREKVGFGRAGRSKAAEKRREKRRKAKVRR